ncbi:MAG: hypothetical protein K0R69_2527 [Clostridia bacterium]|jgi:hypothetical protein|nr:hypothetical protein [Clostridia bacterium]
MGFDNRAGGMLMRQYINAARLLTKIKMLRSGKNRMSFVVVEGITDYRLYRKIFNQKTCEIIIGESKSNVTECIEGCDDQRLEGIIGIVDADFWRLENKEPKSDNLFVTDGHDLECMLIHSPAYESILAEYANRNKYVRFEERKRKSLKIHLLENTAKIGYLRWYSELYHLRLRFNELDFNRFLNTDELEVDWVKLVEQTLVHSKKEHLLKKEIILREAKALKDGKHNLWEVCCGHDFIELLCVGLVNVFGEYNAKNLFAGNLEGNFRLAYEYDYFLTTDLYRALDKWQRDHNQYEIFDSKVLANII